MAKFCYEHPDLIREGIIWTGPGYITPEPDPIRPVQVAAVKETPKPSLTATILDGTSFQPVPSGHQKTCKFCGKEFWAKFGTKKYCSEDCYKNGNRSDARHAYNAAHPEKQEQRYCVICRKPLPLDLSRSYKTCGDPDCREDLKKQTKRESNRRARERRKCNDGQGAD